MDHAPINLREAQIQRLVVSGFRFQHACHFILTIRHAAAARHWLRQLVDHVTIADGAERTDSAEAHDRKPGVNIAFTWRGLEKLGLAGRYMEVLAEKAPAFAQGATLRAAQRLGDTGDSDAEFWEAPFSQQTAHILLFVFAASPEALKHQVAELRRLDPTGGALSGWGHPFEGSHFDPDPAKRRVHFGYRDGITRPRLGGIHRSGDDIHAPGEFLLGYPNDAGYNPWLLARAPEDVGHFFRNGSFCIFRKIEQHVDRFDSFVDSAVRQLKAQGMADASREYVLAKLCGRWDDGQVVSAQSPSQPPPPLPPGKPEGINGFDFTEDPKGTGCPFGAHIRRMNPRNDPVVPSRRRPLIRRGIPYGQPIESSGPGEKRGLLGLFFCASIEDQFEHLLAEWGNKNPMGTDNRGTTKDPLAGSHGSAPASFEIPMPDGRSRMLTGFDSWTRTRGTAYGFMPSREALRVIASEHDGAHRGRLPDDCPICQDLRRRGMMRAEC
jgi:deferrochelatase/peroxidase EfeB